MSKRLMMVMMLAHICAVLGLAADPAITVSAKQHYPWNVLVDFVRHRNIFWQVGPNTAPVFPETQK